MKEVTIKLNLEKETKRTRRYQEIGSQADQCVGYIYIQKTCLERIGNPDAIELVIRNPEE